MLNIVKESYVCVHVLMIAKSDILKVLAAPTGTSPPSGGDGRHDAARQVRPP
jgi:hypothetical protein